MSLTSVSLSNRQIIYEGNTPIDHVYFIEEGITSVLASGAKLVVCSHRLI